MAEIPAPPWRNLFRLRRRFDEEILPLIQRGG